MHALLHTRTSTQLMYTHTRAHEHTISTPRESVLCCKRPARREKCLDKLKTRARTHTHVHTAERFQATMLTLYSFPGALLSARWPSEAAFPPVQNYWEVQDWEAPSDVSAGLSSAQKLDSDQKSKPNMITLSLLFSWWGIFIAVKTFFNGFRYLNLRYTQRLRGINSDSFLFKCHNDESRESVTEHLSFSWLL